MPDDLKPTVFVAPAPQELTVFVESGLITEVQKKSLTLASNNLQTMKAHSTPVGSRHFNKIDTMVALRNPSPVSQAREVLTEFNASWEKITKDFHRYREMFFNAKLMRARLNKRRKEAQGTILDGDDRIILEAELALDGARLDAIESEVAQGHSLMKSDILAAAAASDRYTEICKANGKESFTEEDFRKEEILYYLKSAWWYATQVFSTVDRRDRWDRPKGEPESRRDAGQRDFEAQPYMKIKLKSEVMLFFQSLTINEDDINKELKVILNMRKAYDKSARENPLEPFSNYFDGWLAQMAAKYQERASAAVAKNGISVLKRISKLMNPDEPDKGDDGDVGKMRRSVIAE